jgi:hypothetical protein
LWSWRLDITHEDQVCPVTVTVTSNLAQSFHRVPS